MKLPRRHNRTREHTARRAALSITAAATSLTQPACWLRVPDRLVCLLPQRGTADRQPPPLRWQRLTGSDRGQPVGWQPFLDDEVSAGARYDIDRQRCPPSGFLRPLQHQALQRAVRVLHMTMPAPAITPRCSTAQRRRRQRRSAGQHWPVTQRHPPGRQHRNVIHTVEDRTHVLRRRDGGSSSPRSGLPVRPRPRPRLPILG